MGTMHVKSWGMTGSNSDAYSAELATETYQGKPVVRMWRSGEGTDGFGAMFQTFKPDAYRGKRLRFSAQLRTLEETDRAALCFRVDGPNTGNAGPPLAFDNMDTRPAISGVSPWTRHSCVLDVSPEATLIFISNILTGKGELQWADVRFEVVDASVPVTDMLLRSDEGPANLDFTQT